MLRFLSVAFLCFTAIDAEKLRVLIISPGSKLMATHFQWHSQIAHRIGQDPEIEPFVEEVVSVYAIFDTIYGKYRKLSCHDIMRVKLAYQSS